MTSNSNTNPNQPAQVLVLGATGKTGRRIAANLEALGVPVRREFVECCDVEWTCSFVDERAHEEDKLRIGITISV